MLQHNRVKLIAIILFVMIIPIVSLSGSKTVKSDTSPKIKESFTGMADVRGFLIGYNRWLTEQIQTQQSQYFVLPLTWVEGFSSEYTDAHGEIKINLLNGEITVNIENTTEPMDIWLVKSQWQDSVMPSINDTRLYIGTAHSQDQQRINLTTNNDIEALVNFQFDRVVVTKAGQEPSQGFLMWGMPTVYQKLYLSSLRGEFGKINQPIQSIAPKPLNTNIMFSLQDALDQQTPIAVATLENMIAQGRDLFVNETFNGNGRTCNTCHRETQNFTISPEFIATLPMTDPLFAAETNPNLAKNFEVPQMLRTFALFVENVDGTDDLANKFTLRSANHTLALSTSLKAPTPNNILDFTTIPPIQRTGWGGDGAPGNGTLKEFALGATAQHMTKTLNRQANVDFRVATDAELDALEAFQLSLGRQEDLDLKNVVLKDKLATMGKTLYLDDKVAKCNACHLNASGGAGLGSFLGISTEFNGSFETGVDNVPKAPKIPLDGGFGRVLRPDGSYGDLRARQFNAPPLIEAADTPPFFHNNAITTIEDAVAFYSTTAFNKAFAGKKFPFEPLKGGIKLTKKQNQSIAILLRVLNVLENVRSSIAIQQRAQASMDNSNAISLLNMSLGEQNDALKVLSEGTANKVAATTNAIQMLQNSQKQLQMAINTIDKTMRDQLISQVIDQERMVREMFVDSTTLPKSFQN